MSYTINQSGGLDMADRPNNKNRIIFAEIHTDQMSRPAQGQKQGFT